MVVLGLLCIVQFASSITLVAINTEQQAEILNKSWVTATNHRLGTGYLQVRLFTLILLKYFNTT